MGPLSLTTHTGILINDGNLSANEHLLFFVGVVDKTPGLFQQQGDVGPTKDNRL